MNRAVIQSEGLQDVAANLPLFTARFAHELAQHPLLALERLAQAAAALEPAKVERRFAQNRPGSAFIKQDDVPLDIGAHIEAIENNPAWIMLTNIDALPEYRALIEGVIAPLRDQIESRCGAIRRLTAFIFVSSQNAVTPFHFDPEYNLFFQIRGQKQFMTCGCEPPIVTDRVHEKLHASGDNMLDFSTVESGAATRHVLGAGDGLYVPYKAPHWVEVGDEPSISLSITWKSDWCLEQEYGHRFNARVRSLGFTPSPLAPWPARARFKAVGGRLLDKLGTAA